MSTCRPSFPEPMAHKSGESERSDSSCRALGSSCRGHTNGTTPRQMQIFRGLCFPGKLMFLLNGEENNHCMWWLDDEKSFCIKNSSAFDEIILGKYFNQTKFDSLIRRLYRWDFKRVQLPKGQRDSAHLGFTHALFDRNQPEKAELIKPPRRLPRWKTTLLPRDPDDAAPLDDGSGSVAPATAASRIAYASSRRSHVSKTVRPYPSREDIRFDPSQSPLPSTTSLRLTNEADTDAFTRMQLGLREQSPPGISQIRPVGQQHSSRPSSLATVRAETLLFGRQLGSKGARHGEGRRLVDVSPMHPADKRIDMLLRRNQDLLAEVDQRKYDQSLLEMSALERQLALEIVAIARDNERRLLALARGL